MANIKSQIKRNRTNEQARLRNKATKSSLKTAVKKFRTAADAGDAETATALLKDASRELDKAASKGVIHRNQAATRQPQVRAREGPLAPPLILSNTPATRRDGRCPAQDQLGVRARAAPIWTTTFSSA